MTIRDRIMQLRRDGAIAPWALVPLRLFIGFGFAAHGYAKLTRGVDFFGATLSGMGVPAAGLMAWVSTLIELVGGVAMMLGAYVVPLSLPFAAIMATAMFGVHLRYGFSSVKLKAFTAAGPEFGPPGYELNLAYLAALASLVLGGPSALSLDRWRARRKRRA